MLREIGAKQLEETRSDEKITGRAKIKSRMKNGEEQLKSEDRTSSCGRVRRTATAGEARKHQNRTMDFELGGSGIRGWRSSKFIWTFGVAFLLLEFSCCIKEGGQGLLAVLMWTEELGFEPLEMLRSLLLRGTARA